MRLVDADVLKKELIKALHEDLMDIDEAIDVVVTTIDDAPTVDHVKHGHWTDNGHIGKRRWCSVCGGIAFEQYDDYGLAEVTESDYCPHCGAYMGVEDVQESD